MSEPNYALEKFETAAAILVDEGGPMLDRLRKALDSGSVIHVCQRHYLTANLLPAFDELQRALGDGSLREMTEDRAASAAWMIMDLARALRSRSGAA